MNNDENWDWSSFWMETINQFRDNITEQEWVMWFSSLTYLSGTEKSLNIAVPSSFIKDQLSQRYGSVLTETLENICGRKLNITFQVSESKPNKKNDIKYDEPKQEATPKKEKKPASSAKRTSQPVHPDNKTANRNHNQLNPDYTFDSFVIGDNNSFAANAAYAISKNPGTAYNPCLFYGGVGLGKTHLIQSIGHSVYKDSPDLKIVYVTAESFTNEFLDMLGKKNMHQFKNKYRTVDVLLIDDIHFCKRKKELRKNSFIHSMHFMNQKNKLYSLVTVLFLN